MSTSCKEVRMVFQCQRSELQQDAMCFGVSPCASLDGFLFLEKTGSKMNFSLLRLGEKEVS